MLFITTRQPDKTVPWRRIDVIANGQPIGQVTRRMFGGGTEENRLVFEAMDTTRFEFRFLDAEGCAFCKGEFTRKTAQGDMLSFAWYPGSAGTVPRMEGPEPTAHAPPLAHQPTFPGLWCWFHPANAQPDCFGLELDTGKCSLEDFRSRIAWTSGLEVRSAHPKVEYRYDPSQHRCVQIQVGQRITVSCPEGSLVDAMLYLESWLGVSNVHPHAACVW